MEPNERSVILLVDDNAQNLELLVAYLDELDARVLSSTSGQQALELAASESPDLVLLDVMMPRMSGFQVCEALKASETTRDVPVVMVTALTETGDVERAIEAGADDYLVKPVNRLELLTRVRSMLRVRRLQAELAKARAEVRALREAAEG